MIKNVAILGATGSIGTSALEVIEKHPDRFAIWGLTSHTRTENCCAIIKKFEPKMVAVSSKMIGDVGHFLSDGFGSVGLLEGDQGINTIASAEEVDIVIAGIAGAAGFASTVSAIRAGKKVLIANKEPLVMLGGLLRKLVAESGAQIVPIDSEHNAIFQCLPKAAQVDCMSGGIEKGQGLLQHGIRGIILTASGGPFLNTPPEEMSDITPDQAAAHPRWTMGRKISIDSATMMNKGLEIIEAYHLFPIKINQISVIIHPESIVHSLVSFCDGSFFAQLANPDMRIPIAYALGWPRRINLNLPKLDVAEVGKLTFLKPSEEQFPALGLAYNALKQGGSAATVMSAANEIAVNSFLRREIEFLTIVQIVEATLEGINYNTAETIEDVMSVDREARRFASGLIRNL